MDAARDLLQIGGGTQESVKQAELNLKIAQQELTPVHPVEECDIDLAAQDRRQVILLKECIKTSRITNDKDALLTSTLSWR